MRLVIIGAGPAGLTVAQTVRAGDPDARITMISAEPFPPYAPPAMAAHLQSGRDDVLFWQGTDVTERLGLDYRAGTRVTAVRTADRLVELDDGEVVPWDQLVIASGARLYAPLPGLDLAGVYDFKSLTAAHALMDAVEEGDVRTALIVGAGFIGVEVALLLSDLGLDVTLIEQSGRVMPRMLDEETAAVVQRELTRHGVRLRLRTRAMAFAGVGHVEHVVLADGEPVRADVYVAATGVKPNIGFLDGSGIEVEWGVITDRYLSTNVPGVWAAGDVAETHDRLTGERYVHAIFPNAVAQGEVVGHNVLGHRVPYEGSERMNSLKHLGVPVMAVGAPAGPETLAVRTDGTLRQVFLDGGRIVGFRLAGDIRGAGVYRSLMLNRVDVTPYRDRLLDPRFGVGDLVFDAVA